MTRYILTVDLIGSTAEEIIEAPSTEQATELAALMHPEARSITVSGVAAEVRVES
jgi:hypothetical protein